ncbi:hypothetical protein EB796_016438 [Bugula neritina]|uniref:Uncharacterized protein n=1 Tax=Bugula neritina TaxID=10212 RepID=A0A7J7JGB7_BUGNE|nr:hypothetical protein EB796_016438 [Bugula neritina]
MSCNLLLKRIERDLVDAILDELERERLVLRKPTTALRITLTGRRYHQVEGSDKNKYSMWDKTQVKLSPSLTLCWIISLSSSQLLSIEVLYSFISDYYVDIFIHNIVIPS